MDICKGSKLWIRNGNHMDLTCSNKFEYFQRTWK